MKIIGLYLSVGPKSGGSFQYCLSIIENLEKLNKKKITVKVFISNRIWKKFLPKNFEIIYLNRKSFFDNFINYLKFIVINENIYKFFCNFFNNNIKILNYSNCKLIIFPAQEEISTKIKINSISAIHDLMHRYEGHFKEYGFFEKIRRNYNYSRICKYSYKILADSILGKSQIVNTYKTDKNKIKIIPFNVPKYLISSKNNNIFKKYNLPKKKFIFYPAQFWEHKNHINLIKGFNLVQRKISNINLVLVGTEKNNLLKVREEINKLKLSKKVYILGYIDNKDIFSFYKRASVTCYVSCCGPTNIPPIEAMFVGSPLVCSKSYSMAKQVGKGGILVNPNSYKEISNSIFKILNDKKLRKKIISEGFNVVSKIDKFKFYKFLKKELNI